SVRIGLQTVKSLLCPHPNIRHFINCTTDTAANTHAAVRCRPPPLAPLVPLCPSTAAFSVQRLRP
ncbi:hypothetical protein S83_039358, partial [Arachis hypogaea]